MNCRVMKYSWNSASVKGEKVINHIKQVRKINIFQIIADTFISLWKINENHLWQYRTDQKSQIRVTQTVTIWQMIIFLSWIICQKIICLILSKRVEYIFQAIQKNITHETIGSKVQRTKTTICPATRGKKALGCCFKNMIFPSKQDANGSQI